MPVKTKDTLHISLLYACTNRREECPCLVMVNYSLLTVFFLKWQRVMYTSASHFFHPSILFHYTNGSVCLAIRLDINSTSTVYLSSYTNVHTEVLPQQPGQNRVSVWDEVTLFLLLALQ